MNKLKADLQPQDLVPLDGFVLIQLYTPESKAGNIHLPDTAVKRLPYGKVITCPDKGAKVVKGETVRLRAAFGFIELAEFGPDFILIHEDDIVACVKEWK